MTLDGKASLINKIRHVLPKAVLVDVDGTLANMQGIRKPFEWDKVFNDKPYQDIIDLVNDLYENYRIIIMTGRDGVCEGATRKWLSKYGVCYHDLHIRKAGDFRKDDIIKSEIYMDKIRGNFDVKYVIDDRNQVVDMWRSIGLRCLQVQPGDF